MESSEGLGGERCGRASGFGRTLALGAVASLALPLALWALERLSGNLQALRGSEVALGLYWVLVAVSLTAVSRVGLRQRIALASAVFVAGLVALRLTSSLPELAIALTVVVAMARSGFVHRQALARTGMVEVACGLLSLGLAYLLYAPSLLASAFSLWGWFLGQSCRYLFIAIPSRFGQPAGDPFERSRDRLLELLRV